MLARDAPQSTDAQAPQLAALHVSVDGAAAHAQRLGSLVDGVEELAEDTDGIRRWQRAPALRRGD